jgi:hypothetical protein
VLSEDIFCGKAWFGTEPRGLARAEVVQQLERNLGPQLALVRYSSNHNPVKEWVYNGADIDKSRIVWAHDMGYEKNRELLSYYNNRQVWLVEPDFDPPHVCRYQMGGNGRIDPGEYSHTFLGGALPNGAE